MKENMTVFFPVLAAKQLLCCMQLVGEGFRKKLKRLLGSDPDTIGKAEDRRHRKP